MDGGYHPFSPTRHYCAAPIRLIVHTHTRTHTHKRLAYLYVRVSLLAYLRNALIFIIQTTVFSQIA